MASLPDRPRQDDWRYVDRPRPQRSEGFWLLVFAACCGVSTFIMWPSLKPQIMISSTGGLAGDAGMNDVGRRRHGMRLDPNVQPGQVEDRRGDMSRDAGRIAPPPPYTDGRDVEMRLPRYGRHQTKVCSTPWWSTGPLECGDWQDEGGR
jgi:hypothetical protein